MNRIAWYLKQLLPFRYETTCKIDGIRKHVAWRMWLGRCFNEAWTNVQL